MTTQHTPGPWETLYGVVLHMASYGNHPKPFRMAVRDIADTMPDSVQAARLADAAPALLEALKLAERDLAPQDGLDWETLKAVRAAIALAEDRHE